VAALFDHFIELIQIQCEFAQARRAPQGTRQE
jgi:hypothetical protein